MSQEVVVANGRRTAFGAGLLATHGTLQALRSGQYIHLVEKRPTNSPGANQEQTLAGHSGYVHSLAFSPEGATLASGSVDKSVILWDVISGRQKQTLTGHADSVWSVVFSPDGVTLASGGMDKTVILWDAASGRKKQTLVGHTSSVFSVSYSPDGTTLASGSADRTVILWDAALGRKKQTLAGHSDYIHVFFLPHVWQGCQPHVGQGAGGASRVRTRCRLPPCPTWAPVRGGGCQVVEAQWLTFHPSPTVICTRDVSLLFSSPLLLFGRHSHATQKPR
jgi:WD40 repeat protein